MQPELTIESLRRRTRRATTYATAIALAVLAALPAGAATLDRIKETGHIRFGYLKDAPPFSSRIGEDAPDGYAVALCKNVAEQLKRDLALPGLTIDWLPVTPENRFDEVKNGRIDLLCTPATATLSRRQDVSFSIPIFAGGNRAAVRADAPAALRDVLSENRTNKVVWRGTPAAKVLESTQLAVVPGTTGEKWLTERAKTLQVDAHITKIPDYRTALQQLVAGDVDVVFGDRVVMLGALQALEPKARENVVILDRMFTHEPAALALERGDDDFRAAVDRALSKQYSSADFASLYARWVGEFDERVRTFFTWTTLPD